MIHIVNTGNNRPRCIEYRVYLITSISWITNEFKLQKCPTCETRSMIAFVDVKTCPSVDKLLGRLRLFIWLTSSSTLFMNSLMLSSDPGMRENYIFILVARTTPLFFSSKLVSGKPSSARKNALANIGITHHFRVSQQVSLHTFLRDLWEYCRTGIDRVQFSQLMKARTSWFLRGEHRTQARA